MGKIKQGGKNQNQPILSAINFTYQASMLMAGKHNTLSAHYGQICKRITIKARQRMSIDIKRSLCKRCSLAQKPGITAELIIDSTPKNMNDQDDKCYNGSSNQETGEINKISKRRKRIRRGMKSKQTNKDPKHDITTPEQPEAALTIKNHIQVPAVEAKQQIGPNSRRIIDEHKHMLLQCSMCGFQKGFRINSNYSLWLDNSDNAVTKASKEAHKDQIQKGVIPKQLEAPTINNQIAVERTQQLVCN